MKKLLLAILLAVLVVYSLTEIFHTLFGVHIHWQNGPFDELAGVALLGLTAICLVLLGLFITISVIGVILAVLVLSLLGVFIAGIAAFWPVLLLLMIIILMVRDNAKAQ